MLFLRNETLLEALLDKRRVKHPDHSGSLIVIFYVTE